MALIVPEKKLFDMLQYILNLIKLDITNNGDETKTILYYLFKDANFQNIDLNYFELAKDLFCRNIDHPRKLDLRMFFDASRASIPTIHINLPSDSPINDSLGVDAGYIPAMFYDEQAMASQIYTRRFNAMYQIIITSDNVNEVILIYHVIRAFLISMLDLLDINGLQNPKLGGGDIQFNPDLVPPHIFIRSISLNCFYEISIPSQIREKIINSLSFTSIATS